MHWAALDGSRQHGSCRGGRVGIWAGLLAGALGLGSGCSFNLPARVLCGTTDCPTGDMGGSADMTVDPADPNLAGPYKVATAPITLAQQPLLRSGQLLLPSDDGTTLSSKATTYPLVLLAPAQYLDPQLLLPYAQRLASHGMVVALYQVGKESDQASYRSAGVNLISSLLSGMEQVVATRLDSAHVGLAGYDLGAEISATIAAQVPTVRGLALIDPEVVDGVESQLDGLHEMSLVKLAGTQPVLILGEKASNTGYAGAPPCTTVGKNYDQFYTVSTTSTIALVFPTATHGDFTNSYPNTACYGGSMSKSDTQRLAIKYLTAYFQWALLERTSAQAYLTGASFTADAQQYSLSVAQK